MRFRTVLCLTTLFLVCFTVAAWSSTAPDQLLSGDFFPIPDDQLLSGRITAVSDTTFSLEIMKNRERKTIEFQMDRETKVKGILTVGSQATVEYRSNAGKNVAVQVVGVPSSEMNSR